MDNTATLKLDIKRLMVENLMLQINPEEIGDQQMLFGPGGLGLDSVDALQLVVALDKKYGFKIPDPECADRSAALVQIERLGLFPVAVDAAKGAAIAAAAEKASGHKADWRALLPPTLRVAVSQKRKPKLQELATFTQQLANLLSSGMPLTVALNSMTHLESKGISADVSRELKQDVIC